MVNSPTPLGLSVCKTFEKLRAERQPLDSKWADCYRFTCPALDPGLQGQEDNDPVTRASAADQRTADLFDTTATDAARTLASAVLSSLTPPNVRWFNLAPSLTQQQRVLSQASKQWLEDAATTLHTLIHSSNYDAESLEFALHLVTAGIAGLNVEWENGLKFKSWPISHLFVCETLGNGVVDTIYFKQKMTIAELIEKYGEDKLPQNLLDELKNDPYSMKTHDVIVCIRPRIRGGKQSVGKQQRNAPYQSVYALKCGTVLKESGFQTLPTVVPRWLKIPGSAYARGPVYDALPDIKMVNKIRELMLINADMVVNGAYGVTDDGVINTAAVRVLPRTTIPMASKDSLWNINAGGDIQFAVDQIALTQANIRRMLLSDQLGPTEKTIQTAAEVQARTNQVRQILGPVFARLQAEFLSKLIERCFQLARDNGALGTPPDDLREMIVDVKYSSPLARSQKLTEVDALDQLTARLQVFMQAAPEVLDNFDFDKAARELAGQLGVPPQYVREEREIKKMRAARADAQADAQQQAQAQELQLIAAKNQGPVEPSGPLMG